MASSSDKKNSKDKRTDDIEVKDDVVDAEVIDEKEEVIEAVDEMADADGVTKNDVTADDPAQIEDIAEETSAPTPEPVVVETEQRSVFFPMVLGGVVAAGLGYFLAQYIGMQGPTVEQVAALNATIDDQKLQIEEQASNIETLNAALEALGVSLEANQAEVAALVDENTSQDEMIAALDAKVDDKLTPSGNATLPADLSALLQEQKDEIASLQGDLKEMAQFAEGQIQTAQEEAEAAERAEARAKARDALNTVRLALASGDPFEDVLGQIAGATEIPETLSAVAGGVPTQSDLQQSFGAAARSALAASNRELAGDSPSERLGLFLQDVIGARSLTPQEGDSPDAVLSRAEAAVKNGDLGTAIETIAALPESGQSVLTEWSEKAQARSGALEAFSELTNALSAD